VYPQNLAHEIPFVLEVFSGRIHRKWYMQHPRQAYQKTIPSRDVSLFGKRQSESWKGRQLFQSSKILEENDKEAPQWQPKFTSPQAAP
jgi:hypothetical protein